MLPTLQQKLSQDAYIHCLIGEWSNSLRDYQTRDAGDPELLVPYKDTRLATSKKVPVKEATSSQLHDLIYILQWGDT